jgi:hypothetical protein
VRVQPPRRAREQAQAVRRAVQARRPARARARPRPARVHLAQDLRQPQPDPYPEYVPSQDQIDHDQEKKLSFDNFVDATMVLDHEEQEEVTFIADDEPVMDTGPTKTPGTKLPPEQRVLDALVEAASKASPINQPDMEIEDRSKRAFQDHEASNDGHDPSSIQHEDRNQEMEEPSWLSHEKLKTLKKSSHQSSEGELSMLMYQEENQVWEEEARSIKDVGNPAHAVDGVTPPNAFGEPDDSDEFGKKISDY